MPKCWKSANVTPVYKGKNNKQDKNNYRPISLLSNVGKILRKIVFKNLYAYCKQNKLLTWRNSGYKPKDSTINQLISITHKIYKSLEDGNDFCFVSLDATAAFDRVWHSGLIHKLRKIGIGGQLLNFFIDYLSDRKQRVVVRRNTSDFVKINAGVPQGSILGPLLFLIYFNDLPEGLSTETYLFADDTSLCTPITDVTSDFSKINRDLKKLNDWSNQWLVKFNPIKTKYVIFSKKVAQIEYPQLFLDSTKLDHVSCLTHLGITFNSEMTWQDHVHKTEAKSRKIL